MDKYATTIIVVNRVLLGNDLNAHGKHLHTNRLLVVWEMKTNVTELY